LDRLRVVLLAWRSRSAVLIVWHFATFGRKYSLIPPPSDVAIELYDLAFGGIFDDATARPCTCTSSPR